MARFGSNKTRDNKRELERARERERRCVKIKASGARWRRSKNERVPKYADQSIKLTVVVVVGAGVRDQHVESERQSGLHAAQGGREHPRPLHPLAGQRAGHLRRPHQGRRQNHQRKSPLTKLTPDQVRFVSVWLPGRGSLKENRLTRVS